MKKKISILCLVFLLIFSFTGCGSKGKDTVDYDQATMQSYADMIVQSFNNMGDADFQRFEDMSDLALNMTLLQSGLPIEGDNFVTMIEAWKAGIKECGELTEVGDYELTTSNSGATLTAEAVFENRTGELSFTFDEKMNMESLTVNAHYSTGEILKKAGLNTVLGMGTVFVVLIFISFIISLFKFIPAIEKKFSKKAKAANPAPAPAAAPKAAPAAPVVTQAADQDGELAAVIAAAIAAAEGTSTDGFIVRSIKRRKSNRWS
ncbi:OadG family protein [Faecalicatena sp. AGMB00832]|uniref:OadG family protein n=1 Tax=Faecalicatena faecalis TaxID=2726362 RepID=A0ABS6D9V3_9FIRM|nr:OadG family transporter subunit [Faecalicatena sp.]MBU3878404.1 OadG family protein [Faecalicatena faecalis]MCI6464368.1 OadG family protein [Faecalicatena sp.]MDY5620105.1 OadG family transporter subunit [Lachnospiraceae bacterium]